MKILKFAYEKIKHEEAPYYFNYSALTIIGKPIRKWITNSLAPACPFNIIRIGLYRLCGFKIGKGTFIGMHCYLDDMCYDLLKIGNNVIISYGVYFACHGRNQGHYPIVIEDNAYIGMRASIISRNREKSNITDYDINNHETGGYTKEEWKNLYSKGVRIGKDAVVGSCALVNCDVPDGMTAVGVPCRIIEKKDKHK